jgi:hypothetical protein
VPRHQSETVHQHSTTENCGQTENIFSRPKIFYLIFVKMISFSKNRKQFFRVSASHSRMHDLAIHFSIVIICYRVCQKLLAVTHFPYKLNNEKCF